MKWRSWMMTWTPVSPVWIAEIHKGTLSASVCITFVFLLQLWGHNWKMLSAGSRMPKPNRFNWPRTWRRSRATSTPPKVRLFKTRCAYTIWVFKVSHVTPHRSRLPVVFFFCAAQTSVHRSTKPSKQRLRQTGRPPASTTPCVLSKRSWMNGSTLTETPTPRARTSTPPWWTPTTPVSDKCSLPCAVGMVERFQTWAQADAETVRLNPDKSKQWIQNPTDHRDSKQLERARDSKYKWQKEVDPNTKHESFKIKQEATKHRDNVWAYEKLRKIRDWTNEDPTYSNNQTKN